MNIDGEKFKISQYADVIYHCSPKPLDEILQTQDLNANVSRLKKTFSKTKIRWIGCNKFSKKSLSSMEIEFTEFHTRIIRLSISYLVNLEEMIDINYTKNN